MARINIPFNPWSKKRLREGRKVCTSRAEIYGHINDTFIAEQQEYKILGLITAPLWWVVEYLWMPEGAESKEELISVLKSIYRTDELDLDKWVWVHFFRKVN